MNNVGIQKCLFCGVNLPTTCRFAIHLDIRSVCHACHRQFLLNGCTNEEKQTPTWKARNKLLSKALTEQECSSCFYYASCLTQQIK